MKSKILKLFFWHLLFFFLFYELRVALEDQSLSELGAWLELKGGLLNLSSLITFFCYSLGAYLVLNTYYPNSFIKVALGLVVIVLFVIGIRFIIEEIFFYNVFGFDNYFDGMSAMQYVLRNLFYACLHLSFGAVFFFFDYSILKEKQAQRLMLENKKTELAFLRSQVNPHFLFNTLNNIYSLVYQKSDQSLPALEKLTSMLRYSLYEGEEEISLSKEIDYINNFITLEEMRYDYPLSINFNQKGNYSEIKIPPFLLLPLVENAFKHGDMKAPVDIILNGDGNKLFFKVTNEIKTKQKDKVGGIGLENIKKRLQLIYGEEQILKVNQYDSIFEVELEINK